jgi:hypothetical protein
MIPAILGGLQIAKAGLGLFGAIRGGGRDAEAMRRASEGVNNAARMHQLAAGQARTFQDVYRGKSESLMAPIRGMLDKDIALHQGLSRGGDIGKWMKGDVEASSLASKQLSGIRTMSPQGTTSFDTGGVRRMRQNQDVESARLAADMGRLNAQRYAQEKDASYNRVRQLTSDITGENRFTDVELPQRNVANEAGVVGSFASGLNASQAGVNASAQNRNNILEAGLEFTDTLGTLYGKYDAWKKANASSGASSTTSNFQPVTLSSNRFFSPTTGPSSTWGQMSNRINNFRF